MDELQQELFKLQDLKYRDFHTGTAEICERICKNGSSRSFFEGTSTSVL